MSEYLNKLVNNATAFGSWENMRACLDNGYVPTLQRRGQQARLARLLQAIGYRVFMIG